MAFNWINHPNIDNLEPARKDGNTRLRTMLKSVEPIMRETYASVPNWDGKTQVVLVPVYTYKRVKTNGDGVETGDIETVTTHNHTEAAQGAKPIYAYPEYRYASPDGEEVVTHVAAERHRMDQQGLQEVSQDIKHTQDPSVVQGLLQEGAEPQTLQNDYHVSNVQAYDPNYIKVDKTGAQTLDGSEPTWMIPATLPVNEQHKGDGTFRYHRSARPLAHRGENGRIHMSTFLSDDMGDNVGHSYEYYTDDDEERHINPLDILDRDMRTDGENGWNKFQEHAKKIGLSIEPTAKPMRLGKQAVLNKGGYDSEWRGVSKHNQGAMLASQLLDPEHFLNTTGEYDPITRKNSAQYMSPRRPSATRSPEEQKQGAQQVQAAKMAYTMAENAYKQASAAKKGAKGEAKGAASEAEEQALDNLSDAYWQYAQALKRYAPEHVWEELKKQPYIDAAREHIRKGGDDWHPAGYAKNAHIFDSGSRPAEGTAAEALHTGRYDGVNPDDVRRRMLTEALGNDADKVGRILAGTLKNAKVFSKEPATTPSGVTYTRFIPAEGSKSAERVERTLSDYRYTLHALSPEGRQVYDQLLQEKVPARDALANAVMASENLQHPLAIKPGMLGNPEHFQGTQVEYQTDRGTEKMVVYRPISDEAQKLVNATVNGSAEINEEDMELADQIAEQTGQNVDDILFSKHVQRTRGIKRRGSAPAPQMSTGKRKGPLNVTEAEAGTLDNQMARLGEEVSGLYNQLGLAVNRDPAFAISQGGADPHPIGPRLKIGDKMVDLRLLSDKELADAGAQLGAKIIRQPSEADRIEIMAQQMAIDFGSTYKDGHPKVTRSIRQMAGQEWLNKKFAQDPGKEQALRDGVEEILHTKGFADDITKYVSLITDPVARKVLTRKGNEKGLGSSYWQPENVSDVSAQALGLIVHPEQTSEPSFGNLIKASGAAYREYQNAQQAWAQIGEETRGKYDGSPFLDTDGKRRVRAAARRLERAKAQAELYSGIPISPSKLPKHLQTEDVLERSARSVLADPAFGAAGREGLSEEDLTARNQQLLAGAKNQAVTQNMTDILTHYPYAQKDGSLAAHAEQALRASSMLGEPMDKHEREKLIMLSMGKASEEQMSPSDKQQRDWTSKAKNNVPYSVQGMIVGAMAGAAHAAGGSQSDLISEGYSLDNSEGDERSWHESLEDAGASDPMRDVENEVANVGTYNFQEDSILPPGLQDAVSMKPIEARVESLRNDDSEMATIKRDILDPSRSRSRRGFTENFRRLAFGALGHATSEPIHDAKQGGQLSRSLMDLEKLKNDKVMDKSIAANDPFYARHKLESIDARLSPPPSRTGSGLEGALGRMSAIASEYQRTLRAYARQKETLAQATQKVKELQSTRAKTTGTIRDIGGFSQSLEAQNAQEAARGQIKTLGEQLIILAREFNSATLQMLESVDELLNLNRAEVVQDAEKFNQGGKSRGFNTIMDEEGKLTSKERAMAEENATGETERDMRLANTLSYVVPQSGDMNLTPTASDRKSYESTLKQMQEHDFAAMSPTALSGYIAQASVLYALHMQDWDFRMGISKSSDEKAAKQKVREDMAVYVGRWIDTEGAELIKHHPEEASKVLMAVVDLEKNSLQPGAITQKSQFLSEANQGLKGNADLAATSPELLALRLASRVNEIVSGPDVTPSGTPNKIRELLADNPTTDAAQAKQTITNIAKKLYAPALQGGTLTPEKLNRVVEIVYGNYMRSKSAHKSWRLDDDRVDNSMNTKLKVGSAIMLAAKQAEEILATSHQDDYLSQENPDNVARYLVYQAARELLWKPKGGVEQIQDKEAFKAKVVNKVKAELSGMPKLQEMASEVMSSLPEILEEITAGPVVSLESLGAYHEIAHGMHRSFEETLSHDLGMAPNAFQEKLSQTEHGLTEAQKARVAHNVYLDAMRSPGKSIGVGVVTSAPGRQTSMPMHTKSWQMYDEPRETPEGWQFGEHSYTPDSENGTYFRDPQTGEWHQEQRDWSHVQGNQLNTGIRRPLRDGQYGTSGAYSEGDSGYGVADPNDMKGLVYDSLNRRQEVQRRYHQAVGSGDLSAWPATQKAQMGVPHHEDVQTHLNNIVRGHARVHGKAGAGGKGAGDDIRMVAPGTILMPPRRTRNVVPTPLPAVQPTVTQPQPAPLPVTTPAVKTTAMSNALRFATLIDFIGLHRTAESYVYEVAKRLA